MIQSRDNSQIKAARRLLEARDRRAQGRLLLEGVRLIGDAWESGFRPLVCYYEATAVTSNEPARRLLVAVEEAGIECVVCSPAAFGALSDTTTPQGIAAVFPLPALPLPATPDLALVLDGVRDPGNAGTLLRTAEAAGAQVVLFGPGSVDAFSPKVVRSAMGAHFRLPVRECNSWAEVRRLLPPQMTLHVAVMQASLSYDVANWRAPAALIVGGEAAGASADALAAATPLSIPMAGGTESLNAAIAGAVILFEAARQRRVAGGPRP